MGARGASDHAGASSHAASGGEFESLGGGAEALREGLAEVRKTYIRNLELCPARVNLTFNKENKDTLIDRYQSNPAWATSHTGGSKAVLDIIDKLMNATGSISSAPIRMRGYKVKQGALIKTPRPSTT